MTSRLPSPPPLVRARLRLRGARHRAALATAAGLRRLIALLDPPPEVVTRAITADGIRRAEGTGHPSTLSGRPRLTVLRGPVDQLARVERVDDEWVACSLGVLTATRPIGSQVRLVHPQTGLTHEGRLAGLTPSSTALVRYVITLAEADGHTTADLPLSHPVEVCHA